MSKIFQFGAELQRFKVAQISIHQFSIILVVFVCSTKMASETFKEVTCRNAFVANHGKLRHKVA